MVPNPGALTTGQEGDVASLLSVVSTRWIVVGQQRLTARTAA